MTVALNLFVSVLIGWVGLSLAVGVLVYVCAKLCEFVSHEWKLRRVWRDDLGPRGNESHGRGSGRRTRGSMPDNQEGMHGGRALFLTQATAPVASTRKPFDQETAREV